MKLAITGKGGVGKTTLASTLARLYADEGRTVLAADVDPDANLGLALGLSQEEVDAIVPISKMRTLVEERTGANAANKFFKLNPYVADIPDTFSREINGVKLLVMGTVDVGGSGCVCPEHVMLKSILSALTYRKNVQEYRVSECAHQHPEHHQSHKYNEVTSDAFMHNSVINRHPP